MSYETINVEQPLSDFQTQSLYRDMEHFKSSFTWKSDWTLNWSFGIAIVIAGLISIRLSLSVAEWSIVSDMIFFLFNEPADSAVLPNRS